MSIAVVSIAAAMWIAETGAAEPPVTNEEPVIIDDADLIELGQVLHRGSRVPGKAGLGCDFDGFTGDIVLTVHPGQGGSEITIGINDRCELVVENLRKTRPIDDDGATAAQQSEWRWEAWAYHRLRGKYDAGNGPRDIQSVTEVEFRLRETSTGFKTPRLHGRIVRTRRTTSRDWANAACPA